MNDTNNNNNNGALFHNYRKTSEHSPSYRGHAIVNGENVRITAWVKVSASGTEYISLAFEKEADFQARIKNMSTAPAPTAPAPTAPAPTAPGVHFPVVPIEPQPQQQQITERLEDLPF